MAPILTARPDGQLAGARLTVLPIMAQRLQGELSAGGRLDLSLWGTGRLGSVRLGALDGPVVLGPNRAVGAGWSLHVAQSAPALVVRGVRRPGLSPARRSTPWQAIAKPIARVEREGERWMCRLGWGCLVAEARGADVVVAVGEDQDEADAALALGVEAIVAQAQAHVDRCDALPGADPLLRSMVMQGAHAALSSIRRDAHGAFAGLAAGLAYSAPARTYYRDGYWTLQALLRLDPHAARQQIELLSLGVHDDGEAPSGVILAGRHQSQIWEALRAADPAAAHRQAADWWSDHFDSPLFFILALGDHADATGETDLARDQWPAVRTIFERYRRLSVGGLPRKPRHDRDWADNVYRDGAVAYDLGLWVGALEAVQRLGRAHDPATADEALALAEQARAALEGALWTGDWYADYRRPDGSREAHLTLDSLMLLRYGAAPDGAALQVLAAVRERLESRHNAEQPFGDWGMLCAFPPFGRRRDLRGKSAFPYRYHNGGDWPWLDGVYAAERLRRGLAGWRYPLTRWWEYCLEHGWAGAVEYLSPPFGRGSLLQGWSSFPAAVALNWADRVLAGDPEGPT